MTSRNLNSISRRNFNKLLLSGASVVAGAGTVRAQNPPLPSGQKTEAEQSQSAFELKYMLASCMYGTEPVQNIIPEVAKIGATAIDIWPRPHGNQREQLDEMGEEKFVALMKTHKVTLGCITQFKLGPFGLGQEMKLASRLQCKLIVTGGRGPRGLKGKELKSAIGQFVEKMKPHLAIAQQTGVTIAIENHSNNLIMSPDSMKWLVELCPDPHLAIALAPYHLDQNANNISQLIKALGNRIALFYAWQHGNGCMVKLPKEEELLQMPGRGALDFGPLLSALGDIKFAGWTEIFMHPVPRGIPILESVAQVTGEINRARQYLSSCSKKS